MALDIILIGAISSNNMVGKTDGQNGLPWQKISADMKHFKETTGSNPIVMGRNTFLGLNGRLLPNRKHIVLSTGVTESLTGDVLWLPDSKSVISHPEANKTGKLFVIGRSKTWESFISIATHAVITYIDGTFDGDTQYIPFSREKMSCDSSRRWEQERLHCIDNDPSGIKIQIISMRSSH